MTLTLDPTSTALVLIGYQNDFTSEGAAMHGAVSGYENGYRVITLTDCTAATSPAGHENAISYDFPMFSLPLSAQEVEAALDAVAAERAA